jgi:hypothetical protein
LVIQPLKRLDVKFQNNPEFYVFNQRTNEKIQRGKGKDPAGY